MGSCNSKKPASQMVLKRSHSQIVTARRNADANPQHYPNVNPDRIFVPAGHDKDGPLVTFMRRNDEGNYEYDEEHYNQPFKHRRRRPSGERARRAHEEMEQGDGKVYGSAEEGGPAQAPMRRSKAHGGKKQAAAADAKREEKKRPGKLDGKGKSRADVSEDGRGDDAPVETPMRHSKARGGKKQAAAEDTKREEKKRRSTGHVKRKPRAESSDRGESRRHGEGSGGKRRSTTERTCDEEPQRCRR